MTMAEPKKGRIELRQLTKQYGNTEVVARVDLVIEPGELFTLLGPSGSGKTTILQMIAGFVTPTSGEILVDGENITRVPPHKRGFGMVFQSYSLFPHMSVAANLAYPLEPERLKKDEMERRVTEYLELVELNGYQEKYASQMSGGEQQRVAVARALIRGPRVMLMDEPLSALDRRLRGILQIELRRIQRAVGITMLNVTHDQTEALTMSDRIGVVNKGRIEEVGTPQELYERPRTRFIADFLGTSTTFPATVAEVSGSDVTLRTARGAVIHASTETPVEAGSQVYATIRPERLVVAPDLPEGEQVHDARVTEAVYMGEAWQYTLDVAGIGDVVAKTLAGATSYWPGDNTKVTWKRSDLRVLLA